MSADDGIERGDSHVGAEIPHAKIGQPVTVIFDGHLVGINPETHGVIVKGNSRGAQHIDWTLEFHWASNLYEPAAAPVDPADDGLQPLRDSINRMFADAGLERPFGGAS